MADIVLGIGTSHGPMLVTGTELWDRRLPADRSARHHWRGRDWSFDELVEARRGERLGRYITSAEWTERQRRSQLAIEALADIFAEARVDVAVLVGNDQMEIFDARLNPAFAIFHGEIIANNEFAPERIARMPPGIAEAVPGYIPAGGASYAGHPELALEIIRGAIDDGFDVATMAELPKPETPHAFGFVYRRIMRDRPVPSVPVLINTFYPPNQPRVARCDAFGRSLLRSIRAWPGDARVALIASGGLTHFVIDEEVDRAFLQALKDGDLDRIAAMGEATFQGGTSEIKNWLPVAGAMAELRLVPTIVDYVPCYRSEAGTGNAMGFVFWRP